MTALKKFGLLISCAILLCLANAAEAANCANGNNEYTSSLTDLTIGSLSASFTPSPSTCDNSPYDFSVANATCSFTLPSPFASAGELDLSNVTASWTETSGGSISEKSITWSGEQDVKTLNGIRFILTDVSFDESPSFSGSVTLKAVVDEETSLQDIVYIMPNEDLGNVTITYQEGGTSEFDYSGLSGLAIELKADSGTTKISEITIDEVSTAGKLLDVTLTALPNVSFKAKEFAAKMDLMSLVFDYDIPNKELTYKSGSGDMTLSEITGLNEDSEIKLGLEFNADNIQTTLEIESSMEAFGCNIGPSGDQGASYSCTMNYNFEITEIKAENITMQKGEGNNYFELKSVDFVLKEGKVESISCDAGKVEYATFMFDLTGTSYDGDTKKLTIQNATLDVKGAIFSISNFIMSNGGNIETLCMTGEFKKDPVEAHIDASMDTTSNPKFSMATNVKIKEDSLSGSILVGSQTNGDTTFAYGYAEINITGAEVPIGTTGLEFTQFGAKAGWNYNVTTEQPDKDCAIVLGGTVGVGDTTDAFELVNGITYTLGTSSSIQLMGQVNVPKNNPMMTGELTANYSFGSGEVGGTLSSSLKVPHDTGKYVDLTSGTINYHFDIDGYDVGSEVGAGPSGKLFSIVDMSGSFDLAGDYTTGLQSANISGSLDYNLSGGVYWPESFNEEGGWQASSTLDFGYNFYLFAHLGAAYNLIFNESGFNGRLGADFWMGSTIYVDWPNMPFWGDDDEIIPYYVEIGAAAEVYKRENGQIWLEGSENTCDGSGGATFTLNGDSIDAPIYLYLGTI